VCDFADTSPYNPPTVSNQADIDRLFAGCTSITGDIIIAANYTGSFFLSNVTSISDGIGMQNGPDGLYLPVPSLTSIEVRDLTSISAMNIFNASKLTSVTFSDLATAEDIDIQALSGLALDFPSLQNMSGFLQIAGNISRYVQ
jgi:Receptor L domain